MQLIHVNENFLARVLIQMLHICILMLYILCSQRTVSFTLPVKNLDMQKRHVYYHGCQGTNLQGRKLQRKKNSFSQGERLIKKSYY